MNPMKNNNIVVVPTEAANGYNPFYGYVFRIIVVLDWRYIQSN